eukprot:TRINITY_DN29884_c0_g1_i1.p1 TRINITY_DN29884_c0_g1~~TRINITY_DN29884_c0_g1_i1.p1  ORF type:complete len:860 (+),score=119.50 TRINITY_DN29884_c0_g1_i1:56-2581(+)
MTAGDLEKSLIPKPGVSKSMSTARLKGDNGEGKHGSSHNLIAAMLCCFLSITGGVSLGGIMFPSDIEHPNAAYQVAGMQMGLLAAVISSWVAYFRSDVFCGVPGGIFPPVVAVSSTFFRGIGAENPQTIMFALPMITLVSGSLIYLVAALPLEQMVKGIPYIVFGGFMAGTGVVCIQSGLTMAAGCDEILSSSFLAHSSQWAPPLTVAVLVYAGQQLGAPAKEVLLPLALVFLGLGFYAWRLCSLTEVDLLSARADGWLYGISMPTSPGFYRVWTLQDFGAIRWDLLLTSKLFSAITNVFCLSLLCIVEDLYGVVESTMIKVDMRREVENAALMNVLNGLMGSMPTNLVMSYSITAHKSGASDKSFLLYLSIISTVFFFVADYIIAVMPKMVPAAAIIWVGLAMCWDWIFYGLKKLSRVDYATLWGLILLDLFQGPEVMLVAGLCVTSVQLARRLSAIEIFDGDHTLRTERSLTVYPVGRTNILEEHGSGVMILHLAQGLLFFGSAFQIQDKVEHRLQQASDSPAEFERLRFLVLDLSLIQDMEISGVKVLHFIVCELATEHNFSVMLVGLLPSVKRKLARFFIDADLPREFPNIFDALRYIENQMFTTFQGSHAMLQGTRQNRNMAEVNTAVQSICSSYAASQLLPVAVDVHLWLNNYAPEYHAENVLPDLIKHLEHKQFEEGDVICTTSFPEKNIAEELDQRSPLIWVLSGRVDMVVTQGGLYQSQTSPHAKRQSRVPECRGAGRGSQQRGEVVQIAEIEEDSMGDQMCAGPLDTFSHFFGAFQVPVLTAQVVTKEATVAILTYPSFASLPPNPARLLEHYMMRKRFSHSALRRDGFKG